MFRTIHTLAAAAALAVGFAISSAQAVNITFDFVNPGDGSVKGSPLAGLPGMTTNTFGIGGAPRTDEPGYTGQFTIFPPGGGANTAAPAGDATNFFSVPNPEEEGIALLEIGSSANYFGLYWGSIDRYNTLAFFLGDEFVGAVTGGNLIDSGFGDQVAPGSNLYVNFFFDEDERYDAVAFLSEGFAFESDNHTYGEVPEPATLALLGAGLFGLGMIRRRKSA